MEMKKIVSLLLCAMMLLAVATGCGQSGGTGSTQTGTTPAQDASQQTQSTAQPDSSAQPAPLNYPTKPVELVVGYSAGGGTHLAAELLAPEAEKFLGQPLNITCKPGGGGAIGATYVANSKPDGYTLLYATVSLPTSFALGDLEFAPDTFVGVARCSSIAPVLAVRADAPFDTAPEMVEWIKAHPNEFSWAFPGVGSSLHLCGANALDAMGVSDLVVDVPFDGTTEGLAGVLGGHVTAISCFMSSLSEQVKAGEIKVIGIQDTVRAEDWPDIPTFLEQGYDATVTSWRGVFAPAGVPQEILDYLEEAFAGIIGTDDYYKRAVDLGEGRAYQNSADFTNTYLNDCEMVDGLVTKLGLAE